MILFLTAVWIISAAVLIFAIEFKQDKLLAAIFLLISIVLFYFLHAELRTDDTSLLLACLVAAISSIGHLFLYSFKGRKPMYYAYGLVYLGTIAIVNW